jgi:hypothetical protein
MGLNLPEFDISHDLHSGRRLEYMSLFNASWQRDAWAKGNLTPTFYLSLVMLLFLYANYNSLQGKLCDVEMCDWGRNVP